MIPILSILIENCSNQRKRDLNNLPFEHSISSKVTILSPDRKVTLTVGLVMEVTQKEIHKFNIKKEIFFLKYTNF